MEPSSTAATATADRAFCRAVLPKVSRTFAINLRLLSGGFGEAVRTGYLLCRTADAIEDSWPGSTSEIRGRFEMLRAAVGGAAASAQALARDAAALGSARADLALVAELSRVCRVHRSQPEPVRAVVEGCVHTLAEGMSRYRTRSAGRPPGAPYLDSESELHDYCWVVAGCVGVMLTRLFALDAPGATPAVEERRLALAPVVGEALQLTNILLDWPVDLRRGRCFLPADWLAEQGVSPADLVAHEHPAARALAARLETLARAALDRVPDYLDLVPARHWRYRLFCLWPALWARGSLRCAGLDPEFPWGERRPRLPRSELWRAALGSAFLGHHPRGLRRLYAAVG